MAPRTNRMMRAAGPMPAVWAMLWLALAAAPAAAKVVLPNGSEAPEPTIACHGGKPGGLSAIFSCICTTSGICNIGAPCPGGSTGCDLGKNGTCESRIWHEVNGNQCVPKYIDDAATSLVPKRDAAVKPETFRPACGLTFSLLTRGNAMFQNGFGWYNVVPGKKPAVSDLHLLVDCKTAPGTKVPFSLLNNAAYKGGDIGFFLVTPEDNTTKATCAKGDCCATVARAAAGEGYIYYSEPLHNADYKGSGSYVHLLMFNSKVFSHTFYFAWEDTYNGTTTDFSDFVTGVSGISCSGAGVKCSTGSQGICDLGVSKCDNDGKLLCEGVYKVGAEAEKCDGLDNDCNGKIDDGASCPTNHVCFQGQCVPRCYDSEFPCPAGYECDKTSGLCLDKLCTGVTCKTGEICRKGKCGNGCEGAVCPEGELCQGGVCVDPCAGRTCAKGQICKTGVCLPDCTQCGGVTCALPMACDQTTGDCYNTGCTPACTGGQTCKSGSCVSPCTGVVCPGGETCVLKSGKAHCPPPGLPKKVTDGGVSPSDWGSSLPDTGPTEAGASGDGATKTNKPFYTDDGCSLAPGPDPARLPGLAALLMAALALARRRRG